MQSSDRKPKILVVAASPRTVGGQSVMALRLIDDLRQEGFEVGFVPVDPRPPGILHHLERIKYLRTLVRFFFYLASLVRHVPKGDVVHVFSASYFSFLISPAPAILISRLFHKPVVLNYHSGEAEDHLSRCGRLTRWLLSLPNCIVVQSLYLVGVFRRFGFSATAIPNHIDADGFVSRQRTRVEPKILITRGLEPLYNIPCALRTFRLVQDRYPQAEMTIAGEGSLGESLRKMSEALKLGSVTFTGKVEHDDVGRLYERHDLFLNTSSIDNMPVSILEAFVAGLPVVTTAAGGIPFIVADRETGCLVELDDHEAAAERIVELVENPSEVERLSLAGIEESKKYSWEIVSGQWQQLYQWVVGSG